MLQPSNSGRSAEFLSNNIPQFSGFTGMKESGLIFPLSTTEDIELDIDANFQLVFKKMNKKDNTTKIKVIKSNNMNSISLETFSYSFCF